MASNILNFPVALVVDGIASFIQNRFATPTITPNSYRWNPDDAQSKIRISSTYSIDNAKPGSVPSITIRRTNLQFANKVIDNMASADPNVMTNAKYQDWLDGYVEILCESGVGSEASSIANFLAIEIQANRHQIINTLKFLKLITYYDIGPEIPVEKNGVEVRRWQVVLRLHVQIYVGWKKVLEDDVKFNKATFTSFSDRATWSSDNGIIAHGSSNIQDSTADFGLLNTNVPQLLQAELAYKWYYVLIGEDERLYIVEEIIDNHTLRLSDKDINGNVVSFNPANSITTSYKIVWNTIHLTFELP